jgi:dTDP-L-rhamnose 4-epimerase
MRKILVTGGAGFIGLNLTRRLVQENYAVTIFDNFNPQIHRIYNELPQNLESKVKLVVGDVRDQKSFYDVLKEQEIVVHLAAETGTGQSMYEVERYEDVNVKGTAILLDYLVNNKQSQVKKIVVASSRAVYGEGKYNCDEHGIVYPSMRHIDDLKNGRYEPLCPICDSACQVLATDEHSNVEPSSFYGLTKLMQEKMVLMFAKTLGISAFALRYQNVYGPGQSLSNPYTGILAIFTNQARSSLPIYIFEDGNESRDFVYINDVVEATYKCISHTDSSIVTALNVGSGQKTTVREVVENITKFFNSNSEVKVTGAFREGDIRHNIADISKIKNILDFEPKWSFQDGVIEFLKWANVNESQVNLYEKSLVEMRSKGLLHE